MVIIRVLFFLLLPYFWFPIRVEATSIFGQLLGENSETITVLSRFGQLLNFKKKVLLVEPEGPTPAILGLFSERKSSPKSLTIALVGDSMIDVLWSSLPQLRSALEKYFPGTKLNLYNFGVGASDLVYASYRLINGYQYLKQSFPSVLSVNPDILVLESFAYNNFGDSQEGLDKQWLLIAEITDKVKLISPKTKIILAATIAPSSAVYGDGISGVDWPLDQKKTRTVTVKKYLENLINFAGSQGYPLADAYHASMDSGGEGKLEYISVADHLHLSGPGGVLFCQKVAEVINGLY